MAEDPETTRVNEFLRPRIGKCDAGRPRIRRSDDLWKVVGKNLMRMAKDRAHWRAVEEIYVQLWTKQADSNDKKRCLKCRR